MTDTDFAAFVDATDPAKASAAAKARLDAKATSGPRGTILTPQESFDLLYDLDLEF